MSERISVALACVECGTRNYRTSRKTEQKGQLELKKYCPRCNHHTAHRETK